MKIIDMIVKDMVNRAIEDWVTPKYLYRAQKYFNYNGKKVGKPIEVNGKGDAIEYPKELIKKLWFWRFLAHFSKDTFYVYIERKEINKYKATEWQQCFYWPVEKLNRKT
jgi:hypothetical protein